MPRIEVTEDEILRSLDQLSPAGRQKALRKLLAAAEFLEQQVERNRPRIEALACERGRGWSALTEEERETFVAEIIEDDRRRPLSAAAAIS